MIEKVNTVRRCGVFRQRLDYFLGNHSTDNGTRRSVFTEDVPREKYSNKFANRQSSRDEDNLYREKLTLNTLPVGGRPLRETFSKSNRVTSITIVNRRLDEFEKDHVEGAS